MTIQQIILSPTLRGTVQLPASKSISNRLLLMAALAGGGQGIRNLSEADDTAVMQRVLRACGGADGQTGRFDIGAAGTAMRFLTAYFAVLPGRRILTGSERMRQRPIRILVDALRRLGADIRYAGAEGFPPLEVTGGALQGGTLELPADVSSQYISALLMVGPYLRGGLRLSLAGDVASRPYIDMTLALMRQAGAEAAWLSAREIAVEERPYATSAAFEVENDWSAASYWYELVALSPDPAACIVLPGLREESLQGDSRVRHFFAPLGVQTAFRDGAAVLTKAPSTAEPLAYDLSQQPDLAQTLVVTCALLRRPFRFTGLHSLRIKETDRTAALQNELHKLGFHVEAEGDDAICYHPAAASAVEDKAAPPVSIATYADHRMAMSFAPCAYQFPGLRIEHPEVVSKSYPRFWEELKPFEVEV